jgi:lipopolysaccharide transport system ATP-binding protein
MQPAIRFDHVSKRYQLGEQRRSLRDVTSGLGRRLRGGPREDPAAKFLWAVRDLSFEVNPGEVLGIIGPNGSGKTTSLKLLSRITYPTEGRVTIQGRVASLIELGAGFHAELTGRENVYLNGTILGLSRKEIAARFDDIVGFAELEKFIDTPVKRYSSGMYARLGFSVAVHVSPDVLLVDEVLAVGDQAFQNRCFERMRQMRSSERALVFISHNMFAVRALCSKVLFLKHGKPIALGTPDEAIRAYQNFSAQEEARAEQSPDSTLAQEEKVDNTPIRIMGAAFLNAEHQPVEVFEFGTKMIVRLRYRATQPVDSPTFSFVFFRGDGAVCEGSSTILCERSAGRVMGDGYVEFEIPQLTLIPGMYTMEVAITNQHVVVYDFDHRPEQFMVESKRALHFPRFISMYPGEWRIVQGDAEPFVLGNFDTPVGLPQPLGTVDTTA